jgi:drug/metabolite transporter (DMT)-like permease
LVKPVVAQSRTCFPQELPAWIHLPLKTRLSVLARRSKAELLLVVATFIWGATFVVVKSALTDAPPFPFLAMRFLLAGVLMLAVMAHGRLPRKALLPSLLLGIMLFAGFAFQTWGLVFTTPSKSAFITGFSVILVPVISLLHGYRLRPANAFGAGLGLLGLYFLVTPSRLGAVNRGDLLTLFGAMAFAIHIVLVGLYTRRFSFLHLAPGQIMAVGIIAALAIPLGPSSAVHWTSRLVFAIVVTAFFATAFCFSTQVWAQQYTPPAHTALIFALEPVFAALTSRVITKEHFGGKVLVGSALILAGMVISELWGATAPAPVEG